MGERPCPCRATGEPCQACVESLAPQWRTEHEEVRLDRTVRWHHPEGWRDAADVP